MTYLYHFNIACRYVLDIEMLVKFEMLT